VAFIVAQETPFGVAASYWRVTTLTVNWHDRSVTLVLGGYLDQPARVAGKEPLLSRTLTVGDPEFSHYFSPGGTTLAEAYACLRGMLPWLREAADDLAASPTAMNTTLVNLAEYFRRSHS
jgi:hypothetical protein